MALARTQPLTEMSGRNLPVGKARPARKPSSVSRLSRQCETFGISQACGPSRHVTDRPERPSGQCTEPKGPVGSDVCNWPPFLCEVLVRQKDDTQRATLLCCQLLVYSYRFPLWMQPGRLGSLTEAILRPELQIWFGAIKGRLERPLALQPSTQEAHIMCHEHNSGSENANRV
jgi:hypothetical protein